MQISSILRDWYQSNHRELPWRQTHDSYRIWLSEIILQQTRVAQGLDYYLRFVEHYPTVNDLAQAPLDDVLKLWQGLGYYSRARNLHKAAQLVCERFFDDRGEARFPTAYADLLRLPGVGPYTAAAIASFSSGEAVAVVDGNVYRVLSRLFDIATPIDSTEGQKLFQVLAQEQLDPQHAGEHNQAIMEFGALQCTPASPDCSRCPLSDQCAALAAKTVDARPVKAGKVKVRERHLHYYLFKYKENLWVHQRQAGDIWQGLWEFVPEELLPSSLLDSSDHSSPLAGTEKGFSVKHQLTHQLLHIDFCLVELSHPICIADCEQISWADWQKKAVPKPISEANRRFSVIFGKK